MADPAMIDLTEDPAGRATAFATGCTAAYVFVRNLVMRPAIKSCHERIGDLEKLVGWLKADNSRKDDSIMQLQAVIMATGSGDMRKAMQGVVSELSLEMRGRFNDLVAKLEQGK